MRNIHTDKPEHEDDIYTGDLKDIQEIQNIKPYLTLMWEINKPQFFKDSALLFLRLADKGKITTQTAAYKIAGWQSNKDLMAIPEIAEVIIIAGMLTLPYSQATKKGDKASYNKKQKQLQEMIKKLILDVTLFCSYCNNPFIFTVEEQEIYASKEIVIPPRRCPHCRDLHKAQVDHSKITCEVC